IRDQHDGALANLRPILCTHAREDIIGRGKGWNSSVQQIVSHPADSWALAFSGIHQSCASEFMHCGEHITCHWFWDRQASYQNEYAESFCELFGQLSGEPGEPRYLSGVNFLGSRGIPFSPRMPKEPVTQVADHVFAALVQKDLNLVRISYSLKLVLQECEQPN